MVIGLNQLVGLWDCSPIIIFLAGVLFKLLERGDSENSLTCHTPAVACVFFRAVLWFVLINGWVRGVVSY